jgi:D-alanyl-D-alanine carboxypeptidase/D-alanyl-D-alanine-endopeptidase (penicillin-binding protein 4)
VLGSGPAGARRGRAMRPFFEKLCLLLVALFGVPPVLADGGPKPDSTLAVVERTAATEALRQALDAIFSDRSLRGARVGVEVVDLDRGAVLYSRGAEMLLNPASVTKALTSALALIRLGPEYTYTTTLWATSEPRGETLGGDLYLRGSGDPKVVTEQIYKLASNVAALGIREVRGDLVVDESFFDAVRLGPGWEQDRSERPYQAPVGAASANFNAIEVLVYPGPRVGAPARVVTDPQTAYVKIDSEATTGPAGGRTKVRVESIPDGNHNVLKVTGKIALRHPGWVTWRKIDHPPFYFGTLLVEMLSRVGVRLRGKVRVGAIPAGARRLTWIRSPPLAVLLKDMNKVSQNFMAEQILKTVGALTSGKPGSWENGAQALEVFLEDLGIPKGTYVFKNGSGLNDVNRFSARQVVRVLSFMRERFQVAAEFLASLAVAGADGSVKRRLRSPDTYRRLRVKTGWLRGVSCLAGYVGTKAGRTLAFAVLINNLSRKSIGHLVQQKLAKALVEYPGSAP